MSFPRKTSFLSYLGATICLLLLAGCSAKKQMHGYVPQPSEIAQLQPGQQDKSMVVNLIGTPGFINIFSDNRWNYVSFRTEQIGFEKPIVVEYKVLQLVFNDQNRLQSVDIFNKNNLVPVVFDEEFTPASGRELTVFEQILGNLGRFN